MLIVRLMLIIGTGWPDKLNELHYRTGNGSVAEGLVSDNNEERVPKVDGSPRYMLDLFTIGSYARAIVSF